MKCALIDFLRAAKPPTVSAATSQLPVLRAGLIGAILLAGGVLRAASPSGEDQIIVDPVAIWAMPPDQKSQSHGLRIEGRVSYYDPLFRLCWLERNGLGIYIQLSARPPDIRTGQYVKIEGVIIPNVGLDARSVTVRVIAENAPVAPIQTKGRINDLEALGGRIVTAQGYVDSQLVTDKDHVRVRLIVENRPVICWIKPDDPNAIPDWRGKYCQVTGLFSGRLDLTQTRTSIELWLGRQDQLEVLGELRSDPRFQRPPTRVNQLYREALGSEVVVRGEIVAQQIGNSMIVGDESAQVEIHSIQQERLHLGDAVEVVGKVALAGAQWILDGALYRPAQPAEARPGGPKQGEARVLRSVAELRSLGTDGSGRGKEVELTGVVTWSLPESDFFFVQDLTGGVRVNYDRAKTGDMPLDKYLRLRGTTRAGSRTPAVDLKDFVDLGSMNHPAAKKITLAQAMTGREDGEWVELRGFVRNITSDGDWRRIHVTTPAGDFTGHLKSPENFVANPGSLIRIQGVCDSATDKDEGGAGIILRMPFLQDITIEEDAPADYYNLPSLRVAELSQLSAAQDMQRVRVTGTVLHAILGEKVFLLQEDTGLVVLSHEKLSLQPGDRLDVVGILGREGARTILREAVYRWIGSEPAPQPIELGEGRLLTSAADSRLVKVRGVLIDRLVTPTETRLTLQQGSTLFVALLGHPAAAAEPDLAMGTGLELTGIYELVYDDSNHYRTFQVLLRSPTDIHVYSSPPFLTSRSALIIAGALAGCVVLGLVWIGVLRRQVQRQTSQIFAQMEQQKRLEAEIQRAVRLESLGQLAGGMAHEYNNLLTIILGNLSLIRFNPVLTAYESAGLRDIETATLRARDLTRELITFSAGGEPICAPHDLAAMVKAVTQKLLNVPGLRVELNFAPDLRLANVDRDQITQVMQNLVGHALQAMPHGGNLGIDITNTEVTAGSLGVPSGAYLKFVLTDTGIGIPASRLGRIFDPFVGGIKSGSGLGLATAYSIVRKHRGHIEVQSEVGAGTRFSLWLPAADRGATTAKEGEGKAGVIPGGSLAGSNRVLLMDDEDSIRRLGEIVLRRMGLEPTVVADGASAVREFTAAQDAGLPFALLILDLTIPEGMGGQATIETIRRTGSQVPAIVCSGYSSDPVMANHEQYGFQAVIAKPYVMENFMAVVRGLLPQERK